MRRINRLTNKQRINKLRRYYKTTGDMGFPHENLETPLEEYLISEFGTDFLVKYDRKWESFNIWYEAKDFRIAYPIIENINPTPLEVSRAIEEWFESYGIKVEDVTEPIVEKELNSENKLNISCEFDVFLY